MGFSIGRFWCSLFNYDYFVGIWLSLGYDSRQEAFVFQFQFMWLQLCIGFDKGEAE